MLKQEIIDFIHTNYLKKGWELELDSLRESTNGYEVEIYQVSPRSRRRVGRITGGLNQVDRDLLVENDVSGLWGQVMKLFYSPHVKKTAHEVVRQAGNEAVLQEWISQGWVLRKIIYEPDGRTERRSEYVMGYELYLILEQQKMQNEERLEARASKWNRKLQVVLDSLNLQFDRTAGGCPGVESANFQNYRQSFWSFIKDILTKMKENSSLKDIAEATRCGGQSWPEKKILLYADFIVALAEITVIRDQFDWKEIGARYYREIGGSKRFDAYKASFLETLEEGFGFPLHLVGLSSQGVITPIYFAGELNGAGGFRYPQGFLHATTDLTVFQTHFATACQTLWLVENRAVLTRMVAEANFLKDSDSLVIGLDGQIRAGHRKMIADVLVHSKQLSQVLVWCDTDHAGLIIARHVQALLHSAPQIKVKWILSDRGKIHDTPSKNDIYTWQVYEAAMMNRLSAEETGEQEAEMGGAERWMQWLEV